MKNLEKHSIILPDSHIYLKMNPKASLNSQIHSLSKLLVGLEPYRVAEIVHYFKQFNVSVYLCGSVLKCALGVTKKTSYKDIDILIVGNKGDIERAVRHIWNAIRRKMKVAFKSGGFQFYARMNKVLKSKTYAGFSFDERLLLRPAPNLVEAKKHLKPKTIDLIVVSKDRFNTALDLPNSKPFKAF